MALIAALVIAYLACGAVTIKIVFEGYKAKFSDIAVTFLLWPVLAFVVSCILLAFWLAGGDNP